MAHRVVALFIAAIVASAVNGRAQAASPPGDYVVTVANDAVRVDGKPARLNRPLASGSRVTTGDGGRAVVQLPDGAKVQVAPHSQVVVGDGVAVAINSGTVHALCTGACSSIISAGATKVAIGNTDAQISFDGAARVSVRRGSVKVRSGSQEVAVAAGFGARVSDGGSPAVRPLTAAPSWTSAPTRLALSLGGLVRVEGSFLASAPARGWHVEIGTDSDFDDLALDSFPGATDTHFVAPSMTSGNYYARVAPVDADGLEGSYSAVMPVDVSVVTMTTDSARWSTLEPMVNLFCGLDDHPLVPATPLQVDRRIDHTLHCALDAHGARADLYVSRTKQNYRFISRLEFVDQHDGYGRISVEIRDESNGPAVGLPLAIKGLAGETITYEREIAYPGLHVAIVRWKPGVKSLRLSVGIKGGDAASTAQLALEGDPAPTDGLKIASRTPTH